MIRSAKLLPRLTTGFALAVVLSCINAGVSKGYDTYLYNNLQRSRDALIGQRSELESKRTETLGQIDKLNAKVARIDSYLKQVDGSLRDVEDALNNIH